MNYVAIEDIVDRLWYRKHMWREPDPTVTVTGEPGHFGTLIFNFTTPVGWNVYIRSEDDRKMIKSMAEMVLMNYDILVNRMTF